MTILPYYTTFLQAFHRYFPNTKEILHIILSTLTLITICLSAFLASILSIQNRKLRKYHQGFSELLPSVETMEKFLFYIITISFLLLTVLLVSSTSLFNDVFSNKFLKKIALSFLAWAVLAILLCGRFYFGWRGKIAVRWTFFGTSLILLIYISSFLINLQYI